MSKQTSETSEKEFVCEGLPSNLYLSCKGEGFYKELNGKQYCILHYPASKDIERFGQALKGKMQSRDFFFDYIIFPVKTKFEGIEFGKDSSFFSAYFVDGVTFADVEFYSDTHFHEIQVKGDINFQSVRFAGQVKFSNCQFDRAFFNDVEFQAKVDFGDIEFKQILAFEEVIFKDYLKFSGHVNSRVFPDSQLLRLSWHNVHIEKSDRVIFEETFLAPHSFVGTDPRKFIFIDVKWENSPKNFHVRNSLVSIAYRQLAINAEENHRYNEASSFRRLSMSVKNWDQWYRNGVQVIDWDWWRAIKMNWKQPSTIWQKLKHDIQLFPEEILEWKWGAVLSLDWWYWLASRYGESVGKASLVLLMLFFIFAHSYTRVGFQQPKTLKTEATEGSIVPITTMTASYGSPLRLREAYIYSLEVGLLQKPEPKPLTTTARLLVLLQTLLTPVQAALLALAVRRRFMR